MEDTENNETPTKTLEHGLDVLLCFLQYKKELSLTEIAQIVNRNTSSTYRLIVTLEKNNFLIKNPENKKYFLGSTIGKLGALVNDNQDLIVTVHPYLVQIHKQFNENVSLYVFQNFKRLCIDRIESTHALRQTVLVGEELTLTRGGGGTALLAWMPPKVRAAVLRSDPGVNEEQLAKIRADGYSVSRDELKHGTIGLGAPIFDRDGNVIAALNMSGPISRMPEDIIRQGIRSLLQATKEINTELKHDHS